MKGLNLALIFGTAIGLICDLKPVLSFDLNFIRDDEFAVNVRLFQGNIDNEGNPIFPSEIQDFSLVGNWWTIQGTITANINQDPPVSFNSVSINGSIFHNKPTSDGQDGNGPGTPFNFNLTVDKKPFPGGSVTATQSSGPLPHGEHYDTYTASLTGVSLIGFPPFAGYVLKIQGRHTPEPSAILSLLAIGTLGATSTLKRKLNPSKFTEKETTKVG
ncbi:MULTISPECIES: PEP-CTERM sorting domain-containing protein [unclassified Microcystis]|uniref:PEP-CTERM sorting domain-containing protein n=1 Tax=unclassified Microcystis TaxID=2643300 RepID=UPI00258DE405|nr:MULTISPECIES: PEP-CTERM sorting domain-containing protein [unclassified Microcystis]